MKISRASIRAFLRMVLWALVFYIAYCAVVELRTQGGSVRHSSDLKSGRIVDAR